MKPPVPYLFFNGHCREAMNFYRHCFSGNLEIIPYRDAPEPPPGTTPDPDAVMHACLSGGAFPLMGADSPCDTSSGNHIALNIDCADRDEIQTLFATLSEGGTELMPLANMFWGDYFGMILDKYGILWMLTLPSGE